MNRSTRALAGVRTRAGSLAGSVASTAAGSSASASSATLTRRVSSWNSEEVVTSTIGRSMSSSHAGGSVGGSQAHGPTSTTLSGQSLRGYSNGSAVR